jgi:hypothetical protein
MFKLIYNGEKEKKAEKSFRRNDAENRGTDPLAVYLDGDIMNSIGTLGLERNSRIKFSNAEFKKPI